MTNSSQPLPSINVQTQGAHLTSWIPSQALGEQLFVSEKAIFKPGSAIRGGVPICFPQFAEFGSIGKHGFARVNHWETVSSSSAKVIMRFSDTPQTRETWPYKFNAEFIAQAEGAELSMQLKIMNMDDKTFEFTAALHSYFLISNLNKVQVKGLESQSFWDNGTPAEQRTIDTKSILNFDGFIDRVYFDVKQPVQLIDSDLTKTITSEGFKDIVIWNPGEGDAKELVDLDDKEYKRMLCIESAVVDKPVILKPNDSWVGVQRINIGG